MSGAIKQIMAWLRTILSKLLSKLTDLLPGRQPAAHVDKALDIKLGRDIKKRRERGVGRGVDTRRGGPNMPRRQPCSSCHKSAKRTRKTEGGAYYKCGEHGEFFVRYPGL